MAGAGVTAYFFRICERRQVNASRWCGLHHWHGVKQSMARTAEADANGKLSDKAYLKELRRLQAKLCELQNWVTHKGRRIIIVFEGRDAAGKGGTIKAL